MGRVLEMSDGQGSGPPGIHRDLDIVSAEVAALRALASDPDKAGDGARVYDFSIRWGVLMSGRLIRLEHYYRAGELTREQERSYRGLRSDLKEAMPLIERFGIARPTVPLEDEEKPDKG